MKQKKRKQRKALGISFLFLLVLGMLFVPYAGKGLTRTARAENAAWEPYLYSLPEAKTDLVYNRQDQELVSPAACKSGFSVTYYPGSDSSAWSYSSPTMREPGTYKVSYRVDIPLATESPYKGTLDNIVIQKYTPDYAPKPKPQDGLVYNGQEQILLHKGEVAQLSNTKVGRIQYQVGDTGNFDEYSNQEITAKDAGTYKISYKIIPDGSEWSYDDSHCINETAPETDSISIAPAPLADHMDITAPSALSGLKYDGNEHTLITPGAATIKAGSLLSKESSIPKIQMEYSLEQNGTYSATLPTAKDAGTYTVWYKVGSDNSNYADTTPQSLTVTIAGNSSGSGSGGSSGSSSSGGSGSSSSSSDGSHGSGSTPPAATPEPSTEDEGEHFQLRSSDGSRTDLWVKKAADGSTIEIRKTTYPDGKTSETETRISADRKTIIKINIYYDADGKRIDSAIEFTKQAESRQVSLSLDALSKILEKDSTGALRKDARITLTSLEEDGTENFTITMDSSIVNEKHPQIYKKNTQGGLFLVNKSYTSTVTENGELLLTIPSGGIYQILGETASKELKDKIYSSIKPEHKKLRLDKGQTARFLMDDGCASENILSITYHSSDKKRVKVTQSGKIQMKKAGKPVTITADVTLADGTVIQTKMKIRSGKR